MKELLNKELNSYNENFLKKYLELSTEEIEGVRVILYQNLQDEFEKRTAQDVNLNIKPSSSKPEIEGQQIEQDEDFQHLDVDNVSI